MSTQQYPGSRWWKFDFHSHTPASSDYRGNKAISHEQWLRDYKSLGLQCVVVTDHNTGAWIDPLKTALAQLKQQEPESWGDFTLFPGMELSCNGGVHLKVILDPQKTSADIDAIRGLVKYQGTPGDSDGVTQLSVEQVIEAIHSFGGIACAAHIDQQKGLLTAVTDHHTLEAILKKLDAVEVIEPRAKCLQNANLKLDKLASVLGSDSHKPKEIGRGFTWVKMSTPSFDGLRLALLDPESAVRRGDQHPDAPQPLPEKWIESITLENMHLRRTPPGALTLSFNPAYNAIIGGRGSGKSTVLECLRLGLAREGELRKLGDDSEIWKTFENFKREYSQRDKPGMMLPGTKISIEVIMGKTESSQRFNYIWSKQPPDGRFVTQVMRWDENSWQETGLDEQQASAHFPVKIFSQKQILALANNPQALLEHIDSSIRDKKTAWEGQFEKRKTALLAARLRVRTLKKELEKKPALELEYKEASRKARVFANANFGPLLKAHQRATQQQRALDDFYQLLANDIAGLQAGIEQAANLASTELTQFLAETPAEVVAHDNAIALKNQLVKQYEHIAVTVSAMQGQLDAAQATRAASAWHQENQVHIQAYKNETARLKGEGINSAQDAATAVATEERLRKQLEQIKIFEAELEPAEKAVELAAEALTKCREALTEARMALVDQLLEQNDMLKVSLRCMASTKSEVVRVREILRLGTGENFAAAIWQEREGQDATGVLWDIVNVEDSQLISGRLAELKQALEEMNQKRHDVKILNTAFRADLVRRIEGLPLEIFDELSWWFPEDEVRLEYRAKKGAPYKNINLASAGQKTAAILSFLLVHGDEPLLLDQPEDDLDNALVSELVVEQLRKNKVHRQLLVVTHNANIVVNADAELVMTMDFDGQITLASAGGLQETAVRKDICRVMEGGEEAFRQRYKRILEDLEARP
jgi:ABC-type lipoprotein export system ATPase subunit/predicted metal-dependent phosphoesterase TrpH